MKLSVLVLGAGGFIGRRVVAALAVTPWVESVPACYHALPGKSWSWVPGFSPTPEGPLREAVDFADVVVNCVDGGARTVLATARALAAVTRASRHPARIVHVSTMTFGKGAIGTVAEGRVPATGDDDEIAASIAAERLVAGCAGSVIVRRLREPIPRRGTPAYVDDTAAAVIAALRQPQRSSLAFNPLPAPPGRAECARPAHTIGPRLYSAARERLRSG